MSHTDGKKLKARERQISLSLWKMMKKWSKTSFLQGKESGETSVQHEMSSCLHEGHPLQVLCKLPCGIMGKRRQGTRKLDILLLLNEKEVRRSEEKWGDLQPELSYQFAGECHEAAPSEELQRTTNPHCAVWNLIFPCCFSLIQSPSSLLKKILVGFYVWQLYQGWSLN